MFNNGFMNYEYRERRRDDAVSVKKIEKVKKYKRLEWLRPKSGLLSL